MGERLEPWRARPSEAAVGHIRSLAKMRMMLVQRPGPTSFVVQEEGSEVKAKVLIGSRVTCSRCRHPGCTHAGEGAEGASGSSASGTGRDVCAHTLFVMLRVLGVPPRNPLVWQTSLVDRELEEIIQCGKRLAKPRRRRAAPRASDDGDGGGVAKGAGRPIEEDERCAICFEELSLASERELVHCASCGNHLHGRCIYVWARHQASLDRAVTCPLCRADWGDVTWRREFAVDPRASLNGTGTAAAPSHGVRERNPATHYGSRCNRCGLAPLQGKRYACVVCRHFDLCEACFGGGCHPNHPFTVQEQPGGDRKPAARAGDGAGDGGLADLENFDVETLTSKGDREKRHEEQRQRERERARARARERARETLRPLAENGGGGGAAEEDEAEGGMPAGGLAGLSLMAVGTAVQSAPASEPGRNHTPRAPRGRMLPSGPGLASSGRMMSGRTLSKSFGGTKPKRLSQGGEGRAGRPRSRPAAECGEGGAGPCGLCVVSLGLDA